MSIFFLVLVGAVAGFLATRLMDVKTNVPTTVLIGVGGALIGGLVLRFVIAVTGWLAGLIGAVVGAMLLIWLWKTYIAR